MVWKESDCVSEREEFVRLSLVEGVNMSELCRRFGVSRKTGYKWRRRFIDDSEASLADRSRRPKQSPGKTSRKIETRVLQMRDSHPAWGPRKIHRRLRDTGQRKLPSPSTIAQHDRRDPEAKRTHRAVRIGQAKSLRSLRTSRTQRAVAGRLQGRVSDRQSTLLLSANGAR